MQGFQFPWRQAEGITFRENPNSQFAICKKLRAHVDEQAVLAWLTKSAQERGAHPEVLAYLRDRARAATQLLVKRAGPDSWLVGRPECLRAFSPRGTGMLALAMLLDKRGLKFSSITLTGEPSPIRTLRSRIVLAIDQVCAVEPAFDFLHGALKISDNEYLSVSDLARYPRVRVDLTFT